MWEKLQDTWLSEQLEDLTDNKLSLTVWEYAELKRVLPKGTPFPGPWLNSRTPYLVEFMDDMSETSSVETSVFMKSIQVGATASVENFMIYIIDHVPGPILYATATKDLGKLWAEQRFDPMVAQADLQDRIFSQVQKRHSKKTGDTSLSKEFPGGSLKIVGYNSAGSLRSTSFRFFLGDEIDEAPDDLKKQGSALEIAEGRTVAYKSKRKIILFSSPTEEDSSKIYKAYLRGDQRKYFIPCPYCGHKQVLDFYKGIKYERDDDGLLISDSVGYECQSKECGKVFRNYHKAEILEKGEWRPTTRARQKNYRSRCISSLYAPPGMITWEDVIQKYIVALDTDDPGLMKTFDNLYLGWPHKERGEAPKYTQVVAHRGSYASKTVPDGVVFLTLAGDVQGDRLEIEVLGHGRKYQTWSIDYIVISGDTDISTGGAWASFLEKFLASEFVYENKDGEKFAPQIGFIDSNYRGETVTEFCETAPGLYPIVGQDKFSIAQKRFEIKNLDGSNLMLIRISTNYYKDRVYASLRTDHPQGSEIPPGYPSFPFDYPDKYFKMLNAEYKRAKKIGGRTQYEYFCPKGRRNEALDVRVYGLCAAEVIYFLTMKNVLKQQIEAYEKKLGRKVTVAEKMEFFYTHMETFAKL